MNCQSLKMASQSQIVFLLLFATNIASLSLAEDSIHGQNCKKKFTDISKNVIKKWEFELDDKIEYPRGDEAMLRRISSLWSEYYACSTRLAHSLTPSNRLPSVIQSSHAGALAQLPCGLCVAPGESGAVKWVYSPSVRSPFSPLEPDERIVMADNGNLTLFNVRETNAGAYRCTIGQSAGGTVILAVVNENEPYNVVKPSTSRGPYATPPRQFQYNGLTLLAFTSWSPWSDCSVCGDVGRRRRYGMCYVKTSRRNYQSYIGKKAAKTNRSQDLLNEDNLFKEFPGGLPCRCRTLPLRLRRLPVVATRRNEIMIGLCKVPCEKGSVYEVRSSSGALLERANNTLEVYSLSQRLPLESPSPTSETVFAVIGKRLTIKCPGTSLRDMPVNWRVGTKKLVPRDADKSSGGRVQVNARDGLVFTEVMYGDANLYSCWQRDALVGTVKLEVWDSSPYWNRHVMLLATLLGAAAVFRVADDLLRNKRRRGTPI